VRTFIRQRRSGVKSHSLKVQKLGGLEVAEYEHLCILSDGKTKVGKERLVGLRDKSLPAFDGLLPRSAYVRQGSLFGIRSKLTTRLAPFFRTIRFDRPFL